MWKFAIFISVICVTALAVEEDKDSQKDEVEGFVELMEKLWDVFEKVSSRNATISEPKAFGEEEVHNSKVLSSSSAYCRKRPTSILCETTTPGGLNLYFVLKKR
ncbi:CLUMA_CG014732, isoform A [Clunio marinus]|uniref:CLUMA_CG014732, isoform A n=1 Tax=Clunio marinus TaxID=568069 RepID=A0A1J1IM75_9DIPT|nr:CLUMA_CG014732, isoform A [Clunio marinus]